MESLLIARDRLVDDPRRDFALLPSYDLYAATLQILVDMEEVLHFLQIMLREIGDVEVLVVIRVVTRHRQNLVVGLPAVEHLEHAERPAVDLATRKGRLIDADENVQRITIFVQGARDESVVAGIVHG